VKVLALDIGGSKLIAALVEVSDNAFDIGRTAVRILRSDCSREQLLALIDESVDELDSSELGSRGFERIGATIPGLADRATGNWVYACFSGIRDFPIASALSDRYGKPVAIDNDVNACAWAEKVYGKCRQIDNYLWVTVSNGIGGGLVLDGKLFMGHGGGAGEIGHFGIADQDAFLCGCGNGGCLEAEAAGPGIARRYVLRNSQCVKSQCNGDTAQDGQNFTARDVADLARAGDKLALSVMETTGEMLGKAVSYAANLLNLETIVFGGGVMESFDLLYPFMERAFRSRLFRSANPSVRLVKTGLGYHAALAGAAMLAVQNDNS